MGVNMEYLDTGIKLISKIKTLGYEAYLIGGCVRDYLLDITSNDIDVATNMPLDIIKSEFDYKDNGGDYLSITIKYEGIYFEITHFRKDISYEDHRHPTVIEVDNLYEDTLRRDFTINALAFDYNKKIIDYHNGIDDLKNKLIKAIGDPTTRFEEDALRILRALYFSSKLGFEIEKSTLDVIIAKSYLLSSLSNDRIYNYFIKLCEAKYSKGINYIKEYDLFRYIPDFNSWLDATGHGYKKEELVYIYYLKYNKFPPVITSKEKKLCLSLKNLVDNHFDNYSLYRNRENVYKLSFIIDRLNVNSKQLKQKIMNMQISTDSDLAVSKLEITKDFEGEMKSAVVNEVIKAIVSDAIPNEREAILTFIKGLKHAN